MNEFFANLRWPSLPSLQEWIDMLLPFYGTYGYPIVWFAAMLENTFIVTWFVPGGTMVLLGGVYAQRGALDLPLVILVGWIGTFCGASIDYAIGRFGERTWPLNRLLADKAVAGPRHRAGQMLAKYGLWALMVSHFFGQVRSLVAVSAGLTRLPYWRFALYEAPAALAWATLYGLGGYFLADQIPLFEWILQRFGLVVVILTIAFIAYKMLKPSFGRRSTPPIAAPEGGTPQNPV